MQRLGESGVQASSWEAVLRHLVGRWQGGDVESKQPGVGVPVGDAEG